MNTTPDRRFNVPVLLFGILAILMSGSWLYEGEITIRHKTGRQTLSQESQRPVVGQIPGDHALFYPISLAWGLLGIGMTGVAIRAMTSGNPIAQRFPTYSCVGLFVLIAATALAAWYAKSS